MSLAVAIEAIDAIVLAADSRATFGDPRGMTAVNDTVQKIFPLTNRTACALVGSAETGASLIQFLRQQLAPLQMGDFDQVAEFVRSTAIQRYQGWFGPVNYMMGPAGPMPTPRPDIVLPLVGYSNGAARILTLVSTPPFLFAPNLSTTGFAAAGVVPLAIYLLNRLYVRGLDLEIAKDLAAYCILETASQDGKVGGPLRMAVVRQDADVETLGEEALSEILKRVDRHRQSLKSSFLDSVQREVRKGE